jgi:hypothetical protein
MSASKRVWTVLGLCLALLGRPADGFAQNTGTITARIVDEAAAVVPGAEVTVTDERTGTARSAVSDSRGEVQFVAMPPGAYTVRVSLQGFRTLERVGNILTASGQLSLGDLPLALGNLSEVITVESTGTKVETDNSDYSGLLTSKQIEQIQTKGRDVMSLLRLLPGVRYENDIEAMGDSFGSNVPNVGGQRRAWNQVTVDGLNGNELSGTSRFSSAINLDAIAEVKVLLNTYKAEFGRSGGANVQIVSKSGSANYNGGLYWYGRRDQWNATPWENNRSGLPKPKYHFDTYGANLGGPVYIPGLVSQQADKKLFFFYSLEAPQVERPGPVRLYRMPTERERAGDFSQTFDLNGRPVNIRDPLRSGACNVTTGGPGCFPGNIIPADRIDASTRNLLSQLPLPNNLNHAAASTWNFQRQETSDNPRWNNVLRLDSRGVSNNFFGVLRTFNSNQYGSEITAGPAKWGFFDGAYIFSDSSINGGWTRIIGSNVVNELQTGIRRQTEGFETSDDGQWPNVLRTGVGWTLPQFNPELNELGVIPLATFGLGTTGVDSPDFTFDQRLGSTAQDYLYSIRDTLTWTRGAHTLKFGGYFEYMQNNEARGGTWMGSIQFNNNTTNPLNANHAFANALLGVYNQYTETDRQRTTRNRAWMSEFFAQDTWKVGANLTIDYGARFLWYAPYVKEDDAVANFDPAQYDPARAPRLYQPAIVNGVRVALDPVTGQTLNAVYIGAFVPGTGDENNGMVNAGDGVPRGFRETLAPQIEPRLGMTWDPFGTGTTAIHASAGLFHNARLGGGSLGNLSGNNPFIHNPVLSFGTLQSTFIPGANRLNRPATIEALEWDYETPSSYNWSVGIRRDIGWGTVVDAAYTGYTGRHLEMYYDLNGVPDTARFLDQNPQNRDPTNNAALPAEFLRPYRGYQNIRTRGNSATSDYHSFQLQVNRRYIRGVQFGGAYTYSRAKGLADEDPGNLSIALNRPESYFYATLAQNQDHSVVINYTWDLPRASARWDNAFSRLVLDGWQISGENAFVSGDWAPVILTTSDNFDFTGGEGGNGGDLGGGLRIVRPDVVGDPMSGDRDPITGWFNTDAFARPSGRGDYGDSPRNVVQRPGINNWNLALFKNVGLGGTRRLQVRMEAYNVLNHTQFQDIDRTARFDAAGQQINPNFGTAIGIGSPTRPPRVLQMSVRFSF